MPLCPYCGKEYRKGGTYATHVRNCDGAENVEDAAEVSPDGGSANLDKELETIRARLSRVEQEAISTPSQEKVNGARDDAESALESVGMLRDEVEKLRQRVETMDEYLMATCASCGEEIPLPWREPEHCENCGSDLAWGQMEVDV